MITIRYSLLLLMVGLACVASEEWGCRTWIYGEWTDEARIKTGDQGRVGKNEKEVCADACIKAKEKDPAINGVTVKLTGGCWCKKGPSKPINRNKEYLTCFLAPENSGVKEDLKQCYHQVGVIGNVIANIEKGKRQLIEERNNKGLDIANYLLREIDLKTLKKKLKIPEDGETTKVVGCQDKDSPSQCSRWALGGYCLHPSHKGYMAKNCCGSCKALGLKSLKKKLRTTAEDETTKVMGCQDKNYPWQCFRRAAGGYCNHPSHKGYMAKNCCGSCNENHNLPNLEPAEALKICHAKERKWKVERNAVSRQYKQLVIKERQTNDALLKHFKAYAAGKLAKRAFQYKLVDVINNMV